jgi:heat shock protein HslJ
MLKLLRFATAFATVALVSAIFAGTSAKAAPTGQSTLPAEVLRGEWTLQFISNDAMAAGEDISSSRITINFNAVGTLAGFGGCNNYSGSYTVSGQQLTIAENLVSTMMACEQAVMTREQLYLRLLVSVNAYALKDGKLELTYSDGGNAMTFTSGAGQSGQSGQGETSGLPAEVLRAEWILRYFDSNARAADVATEGISLKFEADNTLAGFSGCNSYSGSYRVSGQQLIIGPNLATTRMACPAAQSALETRYLNLLPTVRSYTASSSELQLVYDEDGSALVYIARGMEPQIQPAVSGAQVGMPNTGEGTPGLLLLLLAGSLVALGAGLALKKAASGEEVA